MKSTEKLRFRAIVASRNEASLHLEKPGDAVLVERGSPRLLVIACPCGCGEHFPINLDSRVGPAWRLYRDRRKGLSLYPSVWRETGCQSHYVIWRDKIYLLGRHRDDFDTEQDKEELANLLAMVDERLTSTKFVSFYDLAESVGVVPWDVLTACRHLVRQGVACEGKGNKRGHFRKV